MKNNNDIIGHKNNFFRTLKGEDELNDSKFNMWKLELQKDLPQFWESMIKRNGR
jgi:hypothetical protein